MLKPTKTLNYKSILYLVILIIIPYFGNAQNWITKYDSEQRSVRCFTVTYEKMGQFGTVWWPNKLDLSQPIELNFIIYLGRLNGNGADGMGFVMHDDPRGFDAIGDKGGGLGFGKHPSHDINKILPSLGIEFDTWYNPDCGPDAEIREDHTTVVYNGDMCNPQFKPIPIKPAANYAVQNIEDNKCYDFRITWTPNIDSTQTINFTIDGHQVFNFTDSIISKVFKGKHEVYYGFTGSTGGAINEQTVCLLGGNTTPFAVSDYKETFVNTPVDINVTANDYDPDGDQLDTINIISFPKNGTVDVLNSDSIKYTPNTGYFGYDSLQYVTCDINSLKCYAKCDTAKVSILVKCGSFKLNVEKLRDNSKCADSIYRSGAMVPLPDIGHARAYIDQNGNKVTSGYTFQWIDPLGNVTSGPENTSMSAGVYQVIATYNTLSCLSDTATITIDNVAPVVNMDVKVTHPLTDCINPNGALQAEIIENGNNVNTEYKIVWYPNTQRYINQIGIGTQVNGLTSQTYYAEAESNVTGCVDWSTATINDQITYPEVNFASINHITRCDLPYGNLEAGVTMDGAIANPSNFTFQWFKGNNTQPGNRIFNEEDFNIDSLLIGFYTVRAITDSTGCESLARITEIEDRRTPLNLNVSLLSEQTSCSVPNGALAATVDGTTTGYSFEWFEGNNTVTPLASPAQIIGANGSQAINLRSQNYTVRATEVATGCTSIATLNVPENLLNVSVNISGLTHQTTCRPENGSATAQGSGGISVYDYYWFDSNPGTNPDTTQNDFQGATYDQLSNGDYWVVAVDQFYRCTSEPLLVEIDPPLTLPDVAFSYTANATCDPTRPNGTVIADVVGSNNSDYNFRWFVGKTTNNSFRIPNSIIPTAQITGSDNETLIGVPDQVFTLRVTNKATNCNDTAVAIVPLGTPASIAVSTGTMPVTNCRPLNGEASANVGGTISGYSFEWYIGDEVKPTPDFSGSQLTGIDKGLYTVVATDDRTSCKTAPVTDSVRYVPGISIVNIQETNGVNSCFSMDGQLEVIHSGGVGPFEYLWYRGNTTDPNNQVGSDKILDGIRQGLYTALVTDSDNGCTDQDTVSINSTDVVPEIIVNSTPLNSCVPPNGSVNVSVVGSVNPADYTYHWFEGSSSKIDGSPDGYNEDHSQPIWNGLSAGEYTVIVKQIAGSQCESGERIVMVDADAQSPAVVMSGLNNTHCLPVFNGDVIAKAQTVNGQNQPINGYSFEWYQTNISNIGPSNFILSQSEPRVANDTIENILSNLNGQQYYTVVVTNNDTQCKDTLQHFINNDLTYPYITNILPQPIIQCGTQGSLEVTALSYGNVTDYTYQWYYQDTLVRISDIDQQLTNLDSGIYLVRSIDNITGCKSIPAEGYVADRREYPVASLTVLQDQTSLNPLFRTGELLASAYEQDGTISPFNYDFYWEYLSSNPVTNLGTSLNLSTETRSNLDSGYYQTTVTNRNTLCTDSKSIYLPLNPPVIEIVNVINTPKTWCNPENGALEVIDVALNGVSDNLSDYRFFLYLENYDPDTTIANYRLDGAITSQFNNLTQGTYYLLAFEKTLHVFSSIYQLEIEDASSLPQIGIDTIYAQTSCNLDPAFHNGGIEINIDGGANPSDYNIEWYTGNTPSGSILSTSYNLSGVTEGIYTVSVENNTSGCANMRNIFVPSEIPKYQVIGSSAPNTNCVNPNGEAVVLVLNQQSIDFNFLWYNEGGNIDINNPDFTGTLVDTLSGGVYTVIAQSVADNSCLSNQLTVTVDEVLEYPDVYIQLDNPLTNCDLTRANGQLSAQSDTDEITSLNFAWFNINDLTDTLSTNRIAQELALGSYVLKASYKTTGCSTTSQPFEMTEQIAEVPPPMVTVVAQLQSCVYPDGAAEASIPGRNNIDFQYRWFDARGNELFTNDINFLLDSLDQGSYSVLAVERTTGCQSEKTFFDIENKIVYPEFDVSTKSATCNMKDGYMQLIFKNDVADDSFLYNPNTNTLIGTVPTITELEAGNYQVEVVSVFGCATSKDFVLPSSVKVFNGVSDNGDSFNDWFVIDCIDEFPDNNVKIFNRGGTLVYEINNYDNAANRFSGQGNRGLYIGSENLPVGTYFYVVDLKNGKKPVTGFLELVR